MKSHHEKLLKMLEAQNKVCKINEHCKTIEHVKNDKSESEGMQIAGEAVAAMMMYMIWILGREMILI